MGKNRKRQEATLEEIMNFVDKHVRADIIRLESLVNQLERNSFFYVGIDKEIVPSYAGSGMSFCDFMRGLVCQLKEMGRYRTSETYEATLNSFMRFRKGKDVSFGEINSDLMLMYEAYLIHAKGLAKNSSSFYMRILRAVYNRAVDKKLVVQQHPFRQVYTGVDKTEKRAVSLNEIRSIKRLDLSAKPRMDFARDMFLLSFYTRGMSFIDMAYLKKSNLANGMLSYRRHKTGQQLTIKWEQCMQAIVKKYSREASAYLLPIIKNIHVDERKQYIYAAHNINRNLKLIGQRLGLSISLTMYVARHSWASIAKSKNIPVSVISEGMGHDSESTTQIYLSSFDNVVINEANSMILACI